MDTRTTQFTHPRAALLGLLAMAAIATACESRMPTATEVSRLSGAGAQKLVAEAASMDPSARQAVYVVDGVQVTSARVEVLPEDSIATIEISRAPVMKVKITTKAMLASQGKVVSGGELHAVLDGTVISAEATQRIIAKPPVPAVYSKRKTSTPSFPTTAALPQPRSNGPTPVMIIDDRVATEAQFAALTPAEILTVNVFKGAAAESRYGVALEKLPGAPAGALASNGVIVVATKRAVSR